MKPTGMLCVVPSRVAVGESFAINVKVLGPVREIACAGNWNDKKPNLRGPFNRNVQRQIQYHDNCLPEWSGQLVVDGGKALCGSETLTFDGENQGVFPSDKRPIRAFEGFCFTEPGFHFIRLTDKVSGITASSNPIYVTEAVPETRIVWGDPHWQTFFSDGIRCPEELFAFARDEAFLDFGAITDHMEGVTDRQWDYFQAVANDSNEPGRFATLIGQEWTHHDKRFGAPGHRNIYYRGDGGPILRSTASDCNTLDKLWQKLDKAGLDAIAIPHHSASADMGVDWDLGWNAKYEKAVEIYSVWGSSECHADDGNPMATQVMKGEMRGRHVIDALRRGYRMGFVGGGDIHDGRPGNDLHTESYPEGFGHFWPGGFTAARVPTLSRETVYDAMATGQTYATTQSRIYLDVDFDGETVGLRAASEEGIREAVIIVNGNDTVMLRPAGDPRILIEDARLPAMASGDSIYIRIRTDAGHMAWSSPVWGD
jgi:Protein of unknown function (DUF3604)